MKLLIIYNFAQKYRTGIFCAIDRRWTCKWIFGSNKTDIKGMDTSLLKDVEFVDNIFIRGPIYHQKGISKEALNEKYDSLIMLGEPFNLSSWNIMLRNRLRRNRKKIYLWSHGWYGREGFLKKWLKRIYFGLADKTFLYGNFAKEVAIMQGFPSDKLAVIHNSLDHDNQVKLRSSLSPSDIYREHFSNDNPVLIFIGRLTKVKSLDMLLDALHLLKQMGKRYNLVFIGDGETHSELEAQTSQLGLTDQVWFYGACYDDSKNAQLIYDADLCVAPGNVGLTAMHTMVFGTPVLTHDNFPMQMPEFEAITPGKTGAFFRYGDTESLAEEIEKWLNGSDNDREEIRRDCYNEIDSFWTPEYQIEVLKTVLDVK